jgi:hypothetical protein
MQELSKTHMKAKVRTDIFGKLQELVNNLEHQHVSGVPMSQEDEYKRVFEVEAERIYKFLGF